MALGGREQMRLQCPLEGDYNRSAGDKLLHVAGPLTAKLRCQLQSVHVEPLECQPLQITDADDLRWQ